MIIVSVAKDKIRFPCPERLAAGATREKIGAEMSMAYSTNTGLNKCFSKTIQRHFLSLFDPKVSISYLSTFY